MSHQVNRCRCGRTIHWPHTAQVGDKWKCKGCGTVWNLVPPGTPGADSSGVNIPSNGHKAKRDAGRHYRNHSGSRYRPNAPRPRPTPPQSTGSDAGLVTGILLRLAALAGLSRN